VSHLPEVEGDECSGSRMASATTSVAVAGSAPAQQFTVQFNGCVVLCAGSILSLPFWIIGLFILYTLDLFTSSVIEG